jgi:hypothetical protein
VSLLVSRGADRTRALERYRNSSGSFAMLAAIRRASFRESESFAATAANFGVSVQSNERHEDEQRKSKRERYAESNSNSVREPVTHGVFLQNSLRSPNHPFTSLSRSGA